MAIGRAALEDAPDASRERCGASGFGWLVGSRAVDANPKKKEISEYYMRPNWSTCAAACAAESSNAGAADGVRTAVASASKA